MTLSMSFVFNVKGLLSLLHAVATVFSTARERHLPGPVCTQALATKDMEAAYEEATHASDGTSSPVQGAPSQLSQHPSIPFSLSRAGTKGERALDPRSIIHQQPAPSYPPWTCSLQGSIPSHRRPRAARIESERRRATAAADRCVRRRRRPGADRRDKRNITWLRLRSRSSDRAHFRSATRK